MKRPNPELNAGVAQARKRILAYIKRGGAAISVASITEFVNGMAERSAKRPGGGGRK